MIDLILLAVFVGTFYGGFKCGRRFATIKEVVDAAWAKVAR